MKRDGLLIILDEFDVIQNKDGIGSLIKSLTTKTVKFAVCGVGRDLSDIIHDHESVARLIEQGALPVKPMPLDESQAIIFRAAELFGGLLKFEPGVAQAIADIGQGYPYFVQLIGKQCVSEANERGASIVDLNIVGKVIDDLRSGRAFPTLESAYQRAIGDSEGRQLLLHLLVEQPTEQSLFSDEVGRVLLKQTRQVAEAGLPHSTSIFPDDIVGSE